MKRQAIVKTIIISAFLSFLATSTLALQPNVAEAKDKKEKKELKQNI